MSLVKAIDLLKKADELNTSVIALSVLITIWLHL